MQERNVSEKAADLIHAYLEEQLPPELSNTIVNAAYEYLGLLVVLSDRFQSSAAFHACIALCRDAEKRVRIFYNTYLTNHD